MNMGKIRKAIASISVVAVLSTLVMSTTAFAFSFTDVKASDWFFGHVTTLVDAGAVDGTKTTFKPGDNIVRAEVAKIIVEFNGLVGDTLGSSMFSDSKAGTWYDTYIGIAAQYGIMSGDAGKTTVRPGDNVNRAEVAKMLVEANGLASCGVMGSDVFPDVAVGTWYDEYMGTAYCYGVLGGYADGTAGPTRSANRAEFSKMTVKASEGVLIDMGDDDGDDDDGGPTGGDVTVSDSDSPDTMTIAASATSVGVLNFEVTAGTGGTTIEAITIKKSGVSTLASGFQSYIYEGTDRLTSGKSLNSESQEIFFTNLGWEVDAGESRTFTLKVDIGATATSGEVRFSVTDIDAGESEVTGLPVESAMHGLSTTAVGTITIEKDSSITNPKVGEQDVIVARFKANAATEDAMLEQFGVYFTGNIDTAAIQNLELYVAGTTDPIATTAGVNAKEVANFVFDTPFTIIKGDTKSFTVKADLNTGRSADTLKAYVDESTDVVAIGAKYGFGMQVTRTDYDGGSCTSSAGDCSYSTLEGGDITISSNGPSATDVATNAKDVVLMNFSLVSVSPVTFKNFEIALTASEGGVASEGGLLNADATANLTDIKIINVDTGKTLMGPVDSTSFVTLTGGAIATAAATDESQEFYKFTDEFSMDAAESLNLALTADIKNDVDLEGVTVIPALSITSAFPEVRDVNNKVVTNTTSIVPSSTITGKTMTVKSPTLTVGLSSDPSDDKVYVKGSKAVKFACFSMQASQSSDIKVTSLTLGSSFDEDNSDVWGAAGSDNSVNLNAVVGSVKLVDGSGVEKVASKSVASAGTVTFDNMNYTVPAGATQLLCVQGDISSDAFKNSTLDEVAFGITAVGSIVAEDKNGNTLAAGQKVGLPLNSGTTDATLIDTHVSGGGSLTIAVDPATAKENLAVAGTTGVAVSKFKFTTTSEGFTVKKISINNRQSAVTDAALGNYDNNVSKVTLSYKDKAGTAKTADGFLTSGTATFSGIDMYIGKDSDEVLTVTADLNSISDASASAGEFVDLNLAFNNFEAVAEGSGETYKADKIDVTVDAASDLDFGTPTFTDGDAMTDVAITAAQGTAGVSFNINVDDDDDASQSEETYPVGTIFCVDEGSSGTCVSETLLVVTAAYNCTAAAAPNASCADALEDVYTVTTIDDVGTTAVIDTPLLYSLPGSGYLTGSNQMHVFETMPTVTVAASSPSGSRSVAASDNAFVFTVAANAKEKVQFRTALHTATCTDGLDQAGANNTAVTAASTTTTVDGSACLATVTNWTAGDTFDFDAGAVSTINQYARASFWIRVSDAGEVADIKYGTNAAAASAIDNIATLAASDCTFSGAATSATFVASSWYFCDVAVPSATTTERYWSFELDEITELTGADTILLDRLVFYNDKIELDLTGDDLDTQANGAHGLVAYLKDGGSTIATGYVAKTTLATAEGGSAKLVFYPINGTDSAIEVSKNTSKDFTVQLNTGTLLAEDAGADDPLTFSMDLGSSVGGLVTNGDVWWNDTNFAAITNTSGTTSTYGGTAGTSYALTTPGIVKWLGQVASTTLNGATMKY